MSDADSPPLVVVLSGPSGAGKDSVLRAALQRDGQLASVVTAKTRAPRPGERHGEHQLFLSDSEFDALLAEDGFLEHAVVYGHRSGVPRDQVERLLAQGKTVVLRTDVQGARTLRDTVPQALLIFLTVPSIDDLERRIRDRAADDEAEIQRRVGIASEEMAQASWFDHVIENAENGLDRAVEELLAVIAGECDRPGRPPPKI
ncbi:MAG: guanylate kinase [Chloroflexi bacterium]|nr:MAG: guanylate kinase [Chloroflexota bacterium]